MVAAALALALLAAPARAATYDVNSLSDADLRGGCVDGQPILQPASDAQRCTLRGALTVIQADTASTANTVRFDVSGTVDVGSPLPPVTHGTFLNAAWAGNNPSQLSYSFTYIELDGHGASFPGLDLEGHGDVLYDFFVHGFTDGVVMGGTGGHAIDYSGIGLGAYGASPPPGDANSGDGLHVLAGSAHDVLGDPAGNPNGTGSAYSGNRGWGIRLDPGSGPTTIIQQVVGGDAAAGGLPGNGLGGIDVESSGNLIGDLSCAGAGCTGDTASTQYLYGAVVPGNVVAANGGPGIRVAPGTSGNSIVGNVVGIDQYFAPAGNHGAGIDDAGDGEQLGSTAQHGENVVSANAGGGIVLRGHGDTVTGDRVGTNAAGTVAVANQGAGITASPSLRADGAHALSHDLVSGNTGAGVVLDQTGNSVVTSTIGTAADAKTALPNGAAGVVALHGAQRIGGADTDRNTIADNEGAGVQVAPGMRGVRIQGNAITDNGGLGIDFPGDPVAPPVLRSASTWDGEFAFHGSLQGDAGSAYAMNLYDSPACDASGAGEGAVSTTFGFIGTDGSGAGFFGSTVPAAVQTGDAVTATSTAPDGTTSQFSSCTTVTGPVHLHVDQAVLAKALSDSGAFQLDVAVLNDGPATATNVVLHDSLPTGMTLVAAPDGCEAATADGTFRCRLDDIAPGAREHRTFLVSAHEAGSLTNHVDVSADELQSVPGDAVSNLAFQVVHGNGGSSGTDGGPRIDEPAPVFAASLRVDHVSGDATFTLPDGQTFALGSYAIVPSGTRIDPGPGTVEVTASLPDNSASSSSLFAASAFRASQTAAAGGLVDATMTAPLDCSARRGSRATATKKRRMRTLWGHAHGRFRIRGSYASASVRGTQWQVTDRCGSTTVRVREGKVYAAPVAGVTPKARFVTTGQRVVFQPLR